MLPKMDLGLVALRFVPLYESNLGINFLFLPERQNELYSIAESFEFIRDL